MEFNQKLQELRKKKGITQEELATSLYVSRTAISKWESGRGYPNIDSLKDLAKFFSVTVDSLISTDEMLIIAEEDSKRKQNNFRDLVFGLLDLSTLLLFFLPFFAQEVDAKIQSVSLLGLINVQNYLKVTYFVFVIFVSLMGILTLALQNVKHWIWLKFKSIISLALGALFVFVLIISSQPYACIFAFTILLIKVLMLIKR